MGKKRIATKSGGAEGRDQGGSRLARKRLEIGVIHIDATFNNTRLTVSDTGGNVISSSSSGTLGFKGAKKGTPFAAAKAGELLGDQGKQIGLKEVVIIVKGVGAGRESAIRSFVAKSGAIIASIEDRTPVPFNGPRPPKPRRV